MLRLSAKINILLSAVMLCVDILSVVMLSAIMPSAIMLSVLAAPLQLFSHERNVIKLLWSSLK